MTMTPEVSIIMSTYNSAATVGEAVASILNQSYDDFEFLIVNDGSTDRTDEILAGFHDPRLRIIDNGSNIGLTRSLNKAIAASHGRYIARQDADDISMPERLQKQTAFLDEHPEVALLGTSRATLDDAGRMVSTTIMPEEPDFRRLLKSNCLVHGSIMIRREILLELGCYNEDFRQSQDYELWLRVARTQRIMNLQEPLYGVRRHSERVTLTKLPQAILFRLLAVNMARGDVSPEVMEQVRRAGIETYYDELRHQDKIKFHQAAKSKYLKYKFFDEASHHLEKIANLEPRSWKARMEMIGLRILKGYHRSNKNIATGKPSS